MNKKQLFFLGARHSIPICLGYISVGIAYAVIAKQTGYSNFETIFMSMICYSGSGQFLAVTQAKEGASLIAIAIGLILLNFRYFIMSFCVFARFKKLDNLRRALFGHFITDEPFAIFTTAKEELITPSYFCGLFLVSWSSWITGAVLGVVASDFFPKSLTEAMGIALYALFIAIVVPAAKKNYRLLAIVLGAAGLNLLLSNVMDSCWAILTTIIICSGIGAFFTVDNNKKDIVEKHQKDEYHREPTYEELEKERRELEEKNDKAKEIKE